jgi:hypothetical protein
MLPGAFKLISDGGMGVNLNWKLTSAFAAGAVLASGIVYLAVKPQDAVKVAAPTVQPPKPPVVAQSQPAPQPAAPPVPPASLENFPVHVRVPVREKPSPMPPPVRHKQEAVVAENVPSPAPPPPIEPPPQAAEVTPPPVPAAPPPSPIAPPAPAEPAPTEKVPVQNVSLPVSAAEARVPHTVTLAAGTLLPVRIGESLSSGRNQPGDTFLATLTQPLVIDGWIIAERGARVEGRVVDATQPGRGGGSSHLGISIVRLATADGQYLRVRTEPFVKDAASSAGTDAAKIAGGAAIGAVIGAIAGGGKGAAIGAGVGGAAGAGDVLLTRGKAAEIPVETRVSFKVQDSVTITERLD